MALAVNTEGKVADTKTQENLVKYLAGALVKMQHEPKVHAEQVATEEAAKVDVKDFSSKEIKDMEKTVKVAAKNYGLQEKMYYHADGDALKKDPMEATARTIFPAIAGVAMGVTGAIANSPEVAIAGMGGAAAILITKATMRFLGEPTNDAEAKKADEFKMLKHTQLALKQLKKVVEAPEKAAAREAYKAEIGRYMTAGNPGGMVMPMVGKDGKPVKDVVTAEDKAAKDAKKADKAAKKAAYKNEVNKLYATTMPGVVGKFGKGGR